MELAPSCVLELAGPLDRMCVVIPKDPVSKNIVQRQAVGDSMGGSHGHCDQACLDLYPKSVLLLEDAAIEVQKRVEACVALSEHIIC
jgi:hypothetical protein